MKGFDKRDASSGGRGGIWGLLQISEEHQGFLRGKDGVEQHSALE